MTTRTVDTAVDDAVIEKYAPDAPDVVKTEAKRRHNAYLAQDIKYLARGRSPQPGALVKSGAAALLYPWRVPGTSVDQGG